MLDLTARYRQSSITHENKQWAIHHTATTTPDPDITEAHEITLIDGIDRYHYETRKFPIGIGYHVLVFPSGRSYRVGVKGTQRAHVLDQNHKYDGLCFVGNYTNKTPSKAALEEAGRIVAESGMVVAGGHKFISPPGYTICPGNWDIKLIKEPRALSKTLNSTQRYVLSAALTFIGMAGYRVVPLYKVNGKNRYEIRED